jgi:poly-gamma-glutamate synthesis protein (capsule biosynthesis protein)
LFYGTDFTLANLEGSFTDFAPKTLSPDNLQFTFSPQLLPGLQTAGFNLLSLANNHSLNFGAEGLAQNKQYLQNFALNYFGDPLNQTDLSLVKEVNGKTIAFVAYHQFASGLENVLTEIERLRPQVDWLILTAHWGNEYQVNFSAKQQELAHQFVDAGADVVLGTHPHVIQPLEIYNNKMIFYSLGNFIFDQTFSQATQEGLGVGLVFQDNKITYYLIPMGIVDFQARLLNYQKSNIILDNLAEKSLLSEEQKAALKTGKIEIEF